MSAYRIHELHLQLGRSATYRMALLLPSEPGGLGVWVRAWHNKHGPGATVWTDVSQAKLVEKMSVGRAEQLSKGYKIVSERQVERSLAELIEDGDLNWIFLGQDGRGLAKLTSALRVNEGRLDAPDGEALAALTEILRAAASEMPAQSPVAAGAPPVEARVAIRVVEPGPVVDMEGWGEWA
jgi:hypothetical protein